MRDQFEGVAYIIEDYIGKRPIRGRKLIDVLKLIEEMRYITYRLRANIMDVTVCTHAR